MKPVLEYLPRKDKESFVVEFFDYNYYPTPWHYHPEFELVLVTESTGKRFMGDDISDFGPGNLAFIGSDLPHLYRNDTAYYDANSGLRAKSIVVHFLENTFGDFLSLPETENLLQLFKRSERGMNIFGETLKIVTEKIYQLLSLKGLPKMLKLIEILNVLADSNEYNFISSHPIKGQHEKDSERLNKIVELVMQSFQKEIRLEEVAELMNMTSSSFSRYFKKRTRKTFSGFVTEIRLGYAAKLLQSDAHSIAEICFESGFNNLSNFNRQFKQFYNMSPLAYRKQY